MNNFVKIYGSIIRSTVWQTAPHVKLTWLTMLILADVDGRVEASIPGLASTAGVSNAQCEEALACFLAPDKYSRTKDHDGRRIEEIPGGWVILNHHIYRDMRSPKQQKEAERQQRYQRRKAAGTVNAAHPAARRKSARHADERDETPTTHGERDGHEDAHDGRDSSRSHHAFHDASHKNMTDPDPDPDLDPPQLGRVDPKDHLARGRESVVVTRPTGARSHFAPEDFKPLPRHVARCAEFKLDLTVELEKFLAHEFERAYSDWNRAFDRWLSTAKTLAQTERFQASQRTNGKGPKSLVRLQPDAGLTGWESAEGEDDEPEAAHG